MKKLELLRSRALPILIRVSILAAFPWATPVFAQTCVSGSQAFAFTGTDQTFTVPASCPNVTIKVWGAGGGGVPGSGYGCGQGFVSKGGGGGYAEGKLTV